NTGTGVPQQATIPRCHLLPSWWSGSVSGWNPLIITHHDWGRPTKKRLIFFKKFNYSYLEWKL
ncbi:MULTISPECIES: hypothetical protein, partial [unclassified Marinobacterium]|uniref:hypothetical protein n=1 Tax=unclassified Marinobacterium TaxID=2644139 RepID=UPI001C2C078A